MKYISVNGERYRVLLGHDAPSLVQTPVLDRRTNKFVWQEPHKKDPNIPEVLRLARLGRQS